VPQSPTCLSSAWRRSYEERSSARAWKGRVFPVDDNSSHWAIWCYNYAICLKKLMFCVLGIFGACHEGLNGAMSLFYRFLGHLWFPFPFPSIGVQHTRKQAFQEDRQQYPQESKRISMEHLWNI
jgi:hypothetical protein